MKYRLIYNSSSETYELFCPQNTPVKEVNLFLHSLQSRGLSSHTMRAYGFDLLAFFNWIQQTIYQPKDLTNFLLLEFVSFQKKSNLNPKSINRRLKTINIFYRFSFGHEIPSSGNYVGTAGYYKTSGKEQHLGRHNRKPKSSHKLKIKEPKKLIQPLQPNEVKVFLRSLKRYRDLSMVYLMLLCGLRSNEVRQLRWEDLSAFENKLKVRGKGNKERIVPLPDIILDSLNKYKQIEYPKNIDSTFVFVCLQGAHRGHPLKPSGVRSLFRYKRKISGVTQANPHRFRHTCGADLAKQKLDVLRIQKLLGHEHFSTSLQYIHLSLDDLTEEYNNALKNIQKRYEDSHLSV